MTDFIVEIMGEEAVACLPNGSDIARDSALWDDLNDCTGSGDMQESCEYVLDNYAIDWRIVAAKMDESGYENRPATAHEKKRVCECIYFESESDFSDERLAEIYLVWQIAPDVVESDK